MVVILLFSFKCDFNEIGDYGSSYWELLIVL